MDWNRTFDYLVAICDCDYLSGNFIIAQLSTILLLNRGNFITVYCIKNAFKSNQTEAGSIFKSICCCKNPEFYSDSFNFEFIFHMRTFVVLMCVLLYSTI